jgi:hypothetical protein
VRSVHEVSHIVRDLRALGRSGPVAAGFVPGRPGRRLG